MYIDALVIRFRNKIAYNEIPLFRGAIISAMGSNCSPIFHNHKDDGFHYRYPLVQYKRIYGQAAIVFISYWAEEVVSLFGNGECSLKLGDSPAVLFSVQAVHPYHTAVEISPEPFLYHISDWLPLNPQNFSRYQSMKGVVERTQLLERILVGNILSACKGLGITMQDTIECKIVNIQDPIVVKYKAMPYLTFSCDFECNLAMPDYIGLGKGASMGHGTISHIIQ